MHRGALLVTTVIGRPVAQSISNGVEVIYVLRTSRSNGTLIQIPVIRLDQPLTDLYHSRSISGHDPKLLPLSGSLPSLSSPPIVSQACVSGKRVVIKAIPRSMRHHQSDLDHVASSSLTYCRHEPRGERLV